MTKKLGAIIGDATIAYPRLFVIVAMWIVPMCLAFIFTYTEEIDSYFSNIFGKETNIAVLFYFPSLSILSFVLGNNLGVVILSFSKKFHTRINLAKTVTEYQFAVKFIYYAIPLLIASLTYDFIVHGTIFLEVTDLPKIEKLRYALNGALAIGIFTPTVTGFITSFFKDFQFYRSLGFLQRVNPLMDNLEKIDNIAYAIDFYNKYLDERMEYKIANVNKIISKLTKTPFIDSFIRELKSSYEREDHLSPLRRLASFVDDAVDENFVIKIHAGEKIKQWSPFAVGLVSSITVMANIIFRWLFP